ncbi:PPOX class F420-dependent oxidoreductase [Streptomyces rectiverticillatus]|uniref:PPOX class F420-dependent oxidoreductase n=1 Tax=Streptomyces rectiverticillatus TaxID=173860 RepID=UPI0015C2DC17|nr:PPOX class F420-dependent oxidoreductase [Streptomyces rectiverticillatus]QLE75620.1 PPOX class F420-dependent oxidoreductase [Streptomyces rectiverticillatus]
MSRHQEKAHLVTQFSDGIKKALDGKVFPTLVTIQPDGSPQTTPVCVKREGGDVLISTTVDRRKTHNMQRDPRVSVMVQPLDNPYVYAELRGTATVSTEGGQELADELSRKYTGMSYAEFYPESVNEGQRVVVRVTVNKVVGTL